MGIMSLIVDRRGTELSLSGNGVVKLASPESPQTRVGLNGLRRMVLKGEVKISSRVLRACQETGVDIVLLSARSNKGAVHLFPQGKDQARLRLRQYECHLKPKVRIGIARQIVKMKIQAQARWLEAHGLILEIERFVSKMEEIDDLNALMGIEGAVSARYFSIWSQIWKNPWSFKTRNRRPPRDPVNALLSLGYTLATSYLGGLASLKGLETQIGFLHSPAAGRPNLILDLLEPVRPSVDQLVWQIMTDGGLTLEHFYTNRAEGCRLTRDGRALFFDAWCRSEDDWLQRPARQSLALVLKALRHESTSPASEH